MPHLIIYITLILVSLLVPRSAGAQAALSPTARSMARQGLVNVRTIDPTIRVSLMYTRADNFTGKVLYNDLREAYLHPLAAQALKKAQRRLKELRPDLSLVIYDATRPMSVQQVMWDAVKRTKHYYYVSNPARGGGLHNYGLAVDITLCDAQGDTLDMGTRIDNMTARAHTDREAELVAQGKISRQAKKNRELLRSVMRHAGFKPLRTEWWHFNLRSRAQAKRHFKVVR